MGKPRRHRDGKLLCNATNALKREKTCRMVHFTICCTTVVGNMQWMIKRVGMIEFQWSSFSLEFQWSSFSVQAWSFKDDLVWTAASSGDPSNYSSKSGKVSAI